jgi:biopolymer transport protein ExbD
MMSDPAEVDMRNTRLALVLAAVVLAAGYPGIRAEEEGAAAIDPPVLTGGAEAFEAAFTVTVTARGEIRLGGEPADWSAIETALCSRTRQKGMIRIHADRSAPWQVVRDVSFMIGEAPLGPSPLWAVKTADGAEGWHQPVIPASMHKLKDALLIVAKPAEGGIEIICPDGSIGVLPDDGNSKKIRSSLAEFHEWEPDQPAMIRGETGVTFGAIATLTSVLARCGYAGVFYVRDTLPLEAPPERPLAGTTGTLRPAEEIRASIECPETEIETVGIDSLVGEVEVIVAKSREILVDGTRCDRDFLLRFIGDKAAPRPEGGGRITRGGQELSSLPVRLLADRDAHWRDVQEVLDACREVGAHRLFFTVATKAGPALLPVLLNLEDTRTKDREANPIRFTLRLRRSCGQDRTFVYFSEIEMGPLPRCTEEILKELPQWRVEGRPLVGAVEAWGGVPFQDVVLAVQTLMGKVDRLELRPAPGWEWAD